MAKQTGLGDGLVVGGIDLSGDIQALGAIAGGKETLNMTGINRSAMERQGGIRDGRIEMTTFFDDTLIFGSHPRLAALPTADTLVTYHRGTALGSPAANLWGKQINYDGSRGEDGSLIFSVNAVANAFGLEWGEQHTAGFRTDTAATNGAGVSSVDGLASAFGLQAYMHVFAFTGTSATVTLQESSDNGAGDAFANVTGGAFTAVTSGPGFQRIATAGNLAVERYLRVVTTGTFSNFIFAVNVVRNATAPSF